MAVAPVVTISAPLNGELQSPAEPITLEVLLADETTPANALTVEIESDIDGIVDHTGATDELGIFSAQLVLSSGTQNIVVRATDEDGQTGSDSVSFPVNGRPGSVELSFNPVEPGVGDAFSAERTDAVDPEGDPVEYAWSWTVQENESAAPAAVPVFAPDIMAGITERGQIWSVTVTPSDEYGEGPSASASVMVGNRAPSVETVALSPNPATTTDDILATPSGWSDIDDDPESYYYSWSVNGEAIEGVDGPELQSDQHAKGDEIVATATPFDGFASGEPVTSETLTIGNTAPQAITVAITPMSPDTSSDLTAIVTGWSDIDGDSEDYRYRWFVDGTEISGETTAVFPAALTAHFQEIFVEATPYDGEDTGLALLSGAVTIVNTAPEIGAVILAPATPNTTDVIVAYPSGWADIDGDEPGYEYAWTINGSATAAYSSALPPSLTNRGDEVQCTVTPVDGTDAGVPLTSDVVTIGNSAPSIGTAMISPTEAQVADTLTCSWSLFIDPDGAEEPDLSTVQWFVDGVPSGTETTLSGAFVGGQTVRCRVTPYDGMEYGMPVEDEIVIANTAPTIASVNISPDPSFAASTLTCSWDTFDDPDGDTDASTLEWTINGDVVSGSEDTLTGGFRDDDIVGCRVVPSDGEDVGEPVATSIEISNTPPRVEIAEVSPSSPDFSETLTCSWSGFYDDDGDDDESSVTWYNETGELIGSGTTLAGAFFGGDAVYCVVTPFDGKDDGEPVLSSSVNVENTPPTLEATVLTPLEARVEDVLLCAPGTTTDPDGDSDFTYTYRWSVSGILNPETSELLTAPAFSRGQTVQCSATPNDGTDDGDEVSSNIVEIMNTRPEVLSVSIAPDIVQTEDIIESEVVVFDADGEDVIVNYQWRVNGVLVLEGPTVTTLNGSEFFQKGDEVRLDVTPRDAPDASDAGSIGVTVSSNTVSVVNSAPLVGSVVISPPTPVAGDLLSCSWPVFVDPDGSVDPDLSTVEWLLDGTVVETGTDYAGAFTGGQTITCRVTPYDGIDYGIPVESDLTVGNTAPSVGVVTVGPSPAYAATPLTCDWEGYSDVDGDGDESYVTWTINAVAAAGDGTTLTAGFRDGDVVECKVLPFDGEDVGEPVIGGISISNTAPSVVSASVSPSSPTYADTLTCTWSGYSDDDFDPDASTVQWFNNVGDLLGSGTTLTGGFVGGDRVKCVVTPNDGKDAGVPVTSSPVGVVNSAPTLENVALSPPNPTVESTLVCSPGTTTDPDGSSAFTYAYRWTVSALPVADETSNTLTAPAFESGEPVQCFVIPNDGAADGAEVASNVVTIQNTPPQATDVTIGPDVVQTNDVISSSVETFDIDGDAVSLQYEWLVNGVSVLSGATVGTLNGAEYFSKGDEVQLDVTPSDADVGATAPSNTVLVLNTPPGNPTVEIVPGNPEPDEDLLCTISVDAPDVDDDELTYTYVWYRDGVETPYTGATLPFGLTAHDEHWECEATVSDDEEVGGFSSDSVVINDRTNPDPPNFDDMSQFANQLTKSLSGDCEPACAIDIFCSDSTGTDAYATTCSDSGRFIQEVSLTRGDVMDCYATCTDVAGNESGPSSVFGTEACSPYDTYETEGDYGDEPSDVIDEWGVLSDSGDGVITISGNVLDDDDDDWYVISASDDVSADIAAGTDYFNFNVEIITGTSDYRFVIHKGGTGAGDKECPTVDGYTEYNWFLQDDGTAAHSAPSDTRQCAMDSPSYNQCENNSDEFYIHVFRLGGSTMSCQQYDLQITNGVW